MGYLSQIVPLLLKPILNSQAIFMMGKLELEVVQQAIQIRCISTITELFECSSIQTSALELQLDLGGSGTGINTGSLKFNGTTFDQALYLSITQGGAAASKAVVLNSTLDYSGINNLGCSILTASTSMASPAITVDTINTSAGLNINYTNLNLNGAAMTSTAAKLNYNDIITLGAFQSSKTMTVDSSGVELMPLGTSSTNNLRFYGGTTNRETMSIYRLSDTNGLVIASRTTSASNNKTYPVLNLTSTDNPRFVGGVSATRSDLFNINWNDKPSVGFASQTHRFCFNIGNTQPYKSGFPHTYTLATSADAFCINPARSSPTPSSGCLYLVSDTVNKMIFNTNTPYSSSFGTAPLTLNSGNVYIKASNALNDGSANFDMPIFMESSNASPIGFGLHLSNGTNAASTNSTYFGTTTSNDLVLMTANTRRVTVTSVSELSKCFTKIVICTKTNETLYDHLRDTIDNVQVIEEGMVPAVTQPIRWLRRRESLTLLAMHTPRQRKKPKWLRDSSSY